MKCLKLIFFILCFVHLSTELSPLEPMDIAAACVPEWFTEDITKPKPYLPPFKQSNNQQNTMPNFLNPAINPYGSNGRDTTLTKDGGVELPEVDCSDFHMVVECMNRTIEEHQSDPFTAFELADILNRYIVICEKYECILPAERCLYNNYTSYEDFCSSFLDGGDEIKYLCVSAVSRGCEQYPDIMEFIDYILEEFQFQAAMCKSHFCSEYLLSCKEVEGIITFYEMAIFEEEACVICGYLPGVTECFANMPPLCYEAIQYGLDEWGIPLNVADIWAPELLNFIHNTLHLYFSQGICTDCLQKCMDCVSYYEDNLAYEHIFYNTTNCWMIGEIGHCIADVIRECDAIWPPSQKVIGQIVDDFTDAVLLFCYTDAIGDACTLSQAHCSPYVPLFDALLNATLLNIENIGFTEGYPVFHLMLFPLLHLSTQDDRTRAKIDAGASAKTDENYDLCDDATLDDAESCQYNAWMSDCLYDDLYLWPNVKSMHHISQFTCWLFDGNYNLDNLLQLPWFANISHDDHRFIREVLMQNDSTVYDPEPTSPPYPHVSQDNILALKAILASPFHYHLLDTSNPTTRVFARGLAASLFKLLRGDVQGVVQVNVHGFFQGSLGVDFSLMMDRDMDLKRQTQISTEIALIFKSNDRQLSVNGALYEITRLLAVVENDGDVTTVEVDFDNPNVCSFYDDLQMCKPGKCEDVEGIPYCRCPDGALATACPEGHSGEHYASNESTESTNDTDEDDGDEEDDDDGEESMELMIVSVVLGIVGLLLSISAISVCLYRHQQEIQRRRAERRRLLLSARRPTPAHIPVPYHIPLVQIPQVNLMESQSAVPLDSTFFTVNSMYDPIYKESSVNSVKGIHPAVWTVNPDF